MNSNAPSHRRYAVPLWIVIYLLLWLGATALVTFETWPDNTLRRRPYDLEITRLAVLRVTADEVVAFDEAISVVSKLPFTGDEKMSQADHKLVTTHLALAEALLLQDQDSLNNLRLSSDPNRWNRDETTHARSLLFSGKQILERRPQMPELRETRWAGNPIRIIVHAVWPPLWKNDKDLTQSLLSSEKAKVEDWVSSILHPRKSTEAVPEARDSKLNAILDGIRDEDFTVLVLALGAWGAAAQALASIANFIGRNRFKRRWTLFYISRPFLGASLALAFYVVLRGGLFSQRATWEDINHIGYAGVAILVGICSTEAMENLQQIAAAFFRPKDKTDGLATQTPNIYQVVLGPETIEIHGADFSSSFIVLENESCSPRIWLRKSPELLTASIGVSALDKNTEFRVINLGENGGHSAAVRLKETGHETATA